MRPKPAYYSVFAIKDGTIVFAMQTRKPPKNSLDRGQCIDEDGIHRWFITNKESYTQCPDREVIIRHLAVAGRLNTRRSSRELLFPRLDQLEEKIDALQQQLDRIELLLADVK
jgi:hypothetical protein